MLAGHFCFGTFTFLFVRGPWSPADDPTVSLLVTLLPICLLLAGAEGGDTFPLSGLLSLTPSVLFQPSRVQSEVVFSPSLKGTLQRHVLWPRDGKSWPPVGPDVPSLPSCVAFQFPRLENRGSFCTLAPPFFLRERVCNVYTPLACVTGRELRLSARPTFPPPRVPLLSLYSPAGKATSSHIGTHQVGTTGLSPSDPLLFPRTSGSHSTREPTLSGLPGLT